MVGFVLYVSNAPFFDLVQMVTLDFEKVLLRIETVFVPTIPNLIRKLCVQNHTLFYGLLIRSRSDPYSWAEPQRGLS